VIVVISVMVIVVKNVVGHVGSPMTSKETVVVMPVLMLVVTQGDAMQTVGTSVVSQGSTSAVSPSLSNGANVGHASADIDVEEVMPLAMIIAGANAPSLYVVDTRTSTPSLSAMHEFGSQIVGLAIGQSYSVHEVIVV
jgi:hypothetical protein